MRLTHNELPRKSDKKTDVEYKNWEIWYWNDNDEKQKLYVKQPELKDVINFCKLKGIVKYTIFNNKKKNVCNDGSMVKI